MPEPRMIRLRAVVCDDEPLAVERLSAMLGRVGTVDVVGAAASGRQALEMVAALRPDVLLIDVEMPDLDGFDVVERLGKHLGASGGVPLLVFVTAFPRFAPDAFDTGAVDFLTKPVRLGRLVQTIERVTAALAQREAVRRLRELEAMLNVLRQERDPFRDEHVWVSRRGEMVRVDLHEVDWISAEGAYVRLHVGVQSYLHRAPIGAIEDVLDPARFLRVHRSHIVRGAHVASIRRSLHGGGELLLHDGGRVPLGRKYATEARRRLLGAGL